MNRLLESALLLLVLFGNQVALGQELAPLEEITARQLGYEVRHWGLEEGLPIDRINSLAQTADGYLWIGGDSGTLSRFDGTRFVAIDTEGDERAYAERYMHLRAGARGDLWIRGKSLALGRYHEGRFQAVPGRQALVSYSGGPMAESNDGSLWIANRNPPCFYHCTANGVAVIQAEAGWRSGSAIQLEANLDGEIWGVWSDNTLFSLAPGGPCSYRWPETEEEPPGEIGGLMRLTDGHLAVCGSKALYRLEGSRWVVARRWPVEIGPVAFAAEQSDGAIWMATSGPGQLLLSQDDRLVRVITPHARYPIHFQDILRDGQDNVWIASHQGLYQVRRTLFRTWSLEEDLPGHRIMGVTRGFDSSVFFTPLAPNVFCRATIKGEEDIVESFEIAAQPRFIVPDQDSAVWALSDFGRVWHWQNGETTLVTNNLAGELPAVIQDLRRSSRGDLWIGTHLGLYLFAQGEFTRVALPGASSQAINCLAEDLLGRLYVGNWNEGVFRIDQGRREPLPHDGEPVRRVKGIEFAPEGVLWALIGDGQLGRWQADRWDFLDPAVTAHLGKVISLCLDGHDGLWLGTESRGVAYLNRNDLLKHIDDPSHPVSLAVFGRGEGLGSLACSGFRLGMLKDPRGRIWVATADGISVVDPLDLKRFREQGGLPKAVIEEVLLDDTTADLGDEAVLPPSLRASRPFVHVPPGTGRVEVRFSAVNLATGEQTRFQYRMGDYSPAWEDAGKGRSAVFHRLPPGDYSFEVRAANPYGVWHEHPTSMLIHVAPLWWQRRSVHLGLGILIALCGCLAYWVRTRVLLRRQALQEEFARELIDSQERERQRVARDLHDGVAQELLLIRNASRMTIRKQDADGPLREHLQEMSDIATHAIADVRSIMQNLRPPELDRLGLTAALHAMLERVETHSSLEIEAHIDELKGLWTPDEEINIYRVVQECLNNVVKHAGAAKLRLDIRNRGDWVRIAIDDDGRGFQLDAPGDAVARSGSGLKGMRERIRLLKGTIEIESQPGTGTHYVFRIPISRP